MELVKSGTPRLLNAGNYSRSRCPILLLRLELTLYAIEKVLTAVALFLLEPLIQSQRLLSFARKREPDSEVWAERSS
jgi:hypothetical protein